MFVSYRSACHCAAAAMQLVDLVVGTALPPFSSDTLLFSEIPLICVSTAQEMFWFVVCFVSCLAVG